MTSEDKAVLREKKNELIDTCGIFLYSSMIALDIFFVFVVFDLTTLFSIVLFTVNMLVAIITVTLLLDIIVILRNKLREKEDDFLARLHGFFFSVAVYVSQIIAYSILSEEMKADTGALVAAYFLIFLVTLIPYLFVVTLVIMAREMIIAYKERRNGDMEMSAPILHENTLKSDIVELQKHMELLKSINHGLSEREISVLEMRQSEMISALELLQGVALACTDEVLEEAKDLIREMSNHIDSIILQRDEKIIAKVGRKIARIKGEIYVK